MHTTTNSIEVLQPGIILNSYRTRSGFKAPYLFEQALEIKSLVGNLNTHLIIDLSKISCPKDSITKLLNHEIVKKSKSTALITKEKSVILFMSVWKKIRNNQNKINCFSTQESALDWINELD